MSEGWFTLHRGWRDNPVFRGEFSRADAWVWLIENACWKPTRHDVKGKTIMLDRGQLCASRERLAEVWGWSPSAVERFLTRLKTEQMIERETGQGKSVLTICNYAKYQDISEQTGQEKEQPTGQRSDRDRTAKEQGNQETSIIPSPNGDGRDAPSLTAADITKAVFDTGVLILTATVRDERQARSIIGRWRKTYSDSQVLTVLSRCQIEQPSEPVEWIVKSLSAEASRAAGQPQFTKPERPSVSQIGAAMVANKPRIAIGGY